MGQDDFAARAGISIATVSRIENGHEVGEDSLWRVAITMGETMGTEFLTEAGAVHLADDLERMSSDQSDQPSSRQSLSYGGPPLTPDEEADVLEFIEFKRAQRDRG